MRRAMLDAMSEDAMAQAARIIQEKARAGDLAAIKLMYAYGIGKPTPAVNPDRRDVEEMQLHQQGSRQGRRRRQLRKAALRGSCPRRRRSGHRSTRWPAGSACCLQARRDTCRAGAHALVP
jgi:hypothetical protein